MLQYSAEGRGVCVACLWQVINGFNSVTDELGSERRPPMMADISPSDASCTHAHTRVHRAMVPSFQSLFMSCRFFF